MRGLGLLLTCPMIIRAAFLPLFRVSNTNGTGSLTTPFGQLPSFRGHCVNDSLFAGWDGALNNNDCFVAQEQLELQAKNFLKQPFTFWSMEYDTKSPRDGFMLPVLAHYSMSFALRRPDYAEYAK